MEHRGDDPRRAASRCDGRALKERDDIEIAVSLRARSGGRPIGPFIARRIPVLTNMMRVLPPTAKEADGGLSMA